MIYGYIRYAKGSLKAVDQRQALEAANCNILVEEDPEEKDCPEFNRLSGTLQAKDVLVVTSLDRLAPTVRQLLMTLAEMSERGVHVRSLKEQVDTQRFGDDTGVLAHLLKSVVAAEHGFFVERIQVGRANAALKGMKLGRRSKLSIDQVAHARRLLDLGEGGRAVARTFSVSEATLYRALRHHPRGA